jgi:hypothetical protein
MARSWILDVNAQVRELEASIAERERTHPAFTPQQIHMLPVSEQLRFTDTPAAHVLAYRDFEHAQLVERRARNAYRRHVMGGY